MISYLKFLVDFVFKDFPLSSIGVLFLLWICLPAGAQKADTIVISRNDTIIKLISPGITPEKLTNLKLEELLKRNSERSLFNRKLHEWLVKSSLNKKQTGALLIQPDHTGKTIRDIRLSSIPPFGGSVYDTTIVPKTWFERLGNKLRFETAPGIIRKTITFSNGDSLRKMDLADSERLLRGLSFINDARIVAYVCPDDTSSVNINVYVQDRYPLAGSVTVKDDQPQITLTNKNILGRGFALNNTLAAPSFDESQWGFRETFRAENIMGHYVNLELDYANLRKHHFFSGSVDKAFLLPETKYAGGISFNRSYINYSIADYPSTEWNNPINYRRQNYWLGRSFTLNPENSTVRSNLYLLGRYMNINFFNNDSPESPVFRSGEFFFTGVGFSRREYYRNKLIYSYGKTEDVPYGFLSTLSYGYHQNDTLSRHFLALHYSYGKALIPSKGYLYFSGDISSYFNKTTTEQGCVNLRSQYISPLIPVGTSQLRSFFELQYVKGFNRLNGEMLYIDERVNGLRGFDYKNQIAGTEKAVFKSEQVFFTRLEPLGFKFAIFSFLDMAFLKENNKGLFEHSPYFSFGAGLRIRNDHMVFNTLQIRLAIMPRVPSGELPGSFRITGEPVTNFRDFTPTQPAISTFY